MVLYQDRLIEITNEGLTFRHYYFPFVEKRISFDQIERIEVRLSSVFGGSWRIWGTGDFRTWFPLDIKRPARDRIFITYLRGRSHRIGFTVQNSSPVREILKERGLLGEMPPT